MKNFENLWERAHIAHGVLEKRATGALPPMEASEFVARLISERYTPGDSVLDVGSGPGHFLVSLQSFLPAQSYHGVDVSPSMVEVGRRQFPNARFDELSIYELDRLGTQYDHVICSNVIPHVDNLGRALKCLFEVTRKSLYVRTLIGDQTFLIRHVHNRDNYSNVSDVEAGDELDENNEPRDFHYFNIYSRGVVAKLVEQLGARSFEILDDNFMDLQKIEREKKTGKNVSKVVDGRIVIGNIICPWAYLLVER
jgi:ubiquinone/menaquinone biosynthesis C-methylase UbiE